MDPKNRIEHFEIDPEDKKTIQMLYPFLGSSLWGLLWLPVGALWALILAGQGAPIMLPEWGPAPGSKTA